MIYPETEALYGSLPQAMSEALNDAITSSSSSLESRRGTPSPKKVSSAFNKIPDETSMGPPTLRVKDLDETLSFYVRTFGLHENSKRRREKERSSGPEIVELSAKRGSPAPLLVLEHDPGAKQHPGNFAGLFHFAVLVPDRKSLAHAFLALQSSGVHFEGFADHLVSESLYLHDPEGNGIEIYRDKPINEWTHDSDGHVVMDTLPLDLAGILDALPAEDRAKGARGGSFPNGARIGHMHLRVTDLARSTKFYAEVLGFHVSADWSNFGAMFLAAGSYHHHVGLNTWHSLDGTAHTTGEAGLDGFTIKLPKDYSSSPSYVRSLESKLRDNSLSPGFGSNEGEVLVTDPDNIPIRIVSTLHEREE